MSNSDVTVTHYKEGWWWEDKVPEDVVVAFAPPGIWREFKGPRFELAYNKVSGPSRQAIADYMQTRRNEYGRRDTMHCYLAASAGWFQEEDGSWYLPLVMYLSTEGHVPDHGLAELSQALLEIPDHEEIERWKANEAMDQDIFRAMAHAHFVNRAPEKG